MSERISSTAIDDEMQLANFCKDKTDRQIAMFSLGVTNSHIKECAARWGRILAILCTIGALVLSEVLLKLGETFNIIPVGHLSKIVGQ